MMNHLRHKVSFTALSVLLTGASFLLPSHLSALAQESGKAAPLSEPLRGELPVPNEDKSEQKAIDQVTDSIIEPSKHGEGATLPPPDGAAQRHGEHHAVLTNTARVVGKETAKGAESLGKGVEVVGRDAAKGVEAVGKGVGKGAARGVEEVGKGAGVVGRETVKGAETVGRGAVVGVEKVGTGTVKGVQVVGRRAVHGAEAVGKGAENVAVKGAGAIGRGAETLGSETKRGAEKLGRGTVRGVEAIGGGAKRGVEGLGKGAKRGFSRLGHVFERPLSPAQSIGKEQVSTAAPATNPPQPGEGAKVVSKEQSGATADKVLIDEKAGTQNPTAEPAPGKTSDTASTKEAAVDPPSTQKNRSADEPKGWSD